MLHGYPGLDAGAAIVPGCDDVGEFHDAAALSCGRGEVPFASSAASLVA